PDEQPHRVVALAGVRRGLHELVQQRPRVGGDGDAVAPYLVPECRGLEGAGHRQPGPPPRPPPPRAAPTEDHPPARRVIQGRDAVDRAPRREGRRGGGPERRLGPAAVADPARPRLLALTGEDDERQAPGGAVVGPVPAG